MNILNVIPYYKNWIQEIYEGQEDPKEKGLKN